MLHRRVTFPVALCAAVIALAGFSSGALALTVSSIQTDAFDGANNLDDTANVTRVTVGGIQYRNLIVPTAADIDGGGASPGAANLYRGQNFAGPQPTSLTDVLVGDADITTGYTDPSFSTPVNVMFGQTISGTAGRAEVFLFDITTGDTWTVQAITGGTAAAPVLGGSASFTANNIGLNADTRRANGTNIGVQDLFGFGVDINSDLGEASIIGVRVTSNGADPSAVVASSGTVDSLTAASTLNNAGLTELQSVTTLERGTVNASDFVGVTVFHLHNSQTTNNALNPGAADPGGANRTSLIDGDLALNTGIINPGTAGTLTAAEQATLGPNNSTINGLGVTFDGGLINGPGIDLVVFEIAPNGFADVDAFIVNRIDGVEGSLLVTPGDYSVTGANLGTQLITADVSSLNGFISGGWAAGGGVDQPWVGVGIDLSDLGYAEFAIASGLLFSDAPGGGNVDFVLIAGLPSALPIPEPATLSLLALGAAGLLGRRRREA